LQNHHQEVIEHLLVPAQLSEGDVHAVLDRLCQPGIDAADLYFQSISSESWYLEEGKVKEGTFDIDAGLGIRVMAGEKTGFAYSDDIVLPALQEAAVAAKSIVKQGQCGAVKAWSRATPLQLYLPVNPLMTLKEQAKVDLLMHIDELARSLDSRVIQVMANLHGEYEHVLVANTQGVSAVDIRPLVRLSVSVIIEDKGRRENGSSGGGARAGYDFFIAQGLADEYVKQAVKQAQVNLEAIAAPAGIMPVILGPGWPGILLHEAIGHGLEGDFNRKGSSAFSGRIGEQVASEQCTIVDDGTLPGRRGSLSIDDEGTPSQATVLIENGYLKAYMQDTFNARLMNSQSTGNGRRESYAHLPMPRMTNTYMKAGKEDPEDIIRSVKKGIYAVNFGGGQVDITSGKFVFSASEAYLIEEGKVCAPIKGATLIGSGPEVLKKVSMVGHDLKLDQGIGTCGKDGQSVPVGVGQPTLKIDAMTVGGTA
jgi:TldD protein